MKGYANKSGKSGIRSFKTGKDHILIEFITGERYLYNYMKPGKKHVEMMKQLAKNGCGLATYISRNIGIRYWKKL